MKTLKLIDGDLCFHQGELQLVEGKQEVAQAVLISLQTRLGEFLLDENVGLDRTHVVGKSLNPEEARYDLVEAVMQEQRVVSVEHLEIVDDKPSRKRKVNLKMSIDENETIELGDVNLA